MKYKSWILFPALKATPAVQVLWVMLLFLLCGPLISLTSAGLPEPPDSILGPGVQEALRQTGRASICIALREPGLAATEGRAPLSGLRSAVADCQARVLAVLTPGEFQLRHRFEAVPGLTGKIFSEAALARLANHPSVLKIDLDEGGGSGTLANSVPKIGANTWHAVGIKGDNVAVAVLDSGMDLSHPDLTDAILHQACFANDDGTIDGHGKCPNGSDRQYGAGAAADDAGHGTHVSGIIASRGTVSSVGVAPKSKIVSIKVTWGPGFSGTFQSFSEIVAGLDYLYNHPELNVKIVNMSLGTNALFSGNCDATYSWTILGANAVNKLRTQGVIAFAASGNDYSGTQMSAPGCLSNAVSVGATNHFDAVADLSNSNSTTDLFAPGIGITSDNKGGGPIVSSGTSMATPHAAGCAALLVKSGRAVTPDAIETLMKQSPFRVTDTTNSLTFPRIDCRAWIDFLPAVRR